MTYRLLREIFSAHCREIVIPLVSKSTDQCKTWLFSNNLLKLEFPNTDQSKCLLRQRCAQVKVLISPKIGKNEIVFCSEVTQQSC